MSLMRDPRSTAFCGLLTSLVSCRQNRRAEYVSAFWHVLNWGEVNRRLLAAVAARGWELRVPPSQEDVREL